MAILHTQNSSEMLVEDMVSSISCESSIVYIAMGFPKVNFDVISVVTVLEGTL